MNVSHDTKADTTDTNRTDDKPTTVRVSTHARFRVQQRLGVIDHAERYVRELLADAVPVEEGDRFPAARAYRNGDVTIVVDGTDDVVTTVVKEADR
jgi:hypothetical protein